jgi:hypothetical protein
MIIRLAFYALAGTLAGAFACGCLLWCLLLFSHPSSTRSMGSGAASHRSAWFGIISCTGRSRVPTRRPRQRRDDVEIRALRIAFRYEGDLAEEFVGSVVVRRCRGWRKAMEARKVESHRSTSP